MKRSKTTGVAALAAGLCLMAGCGAPGVTGQASNSHSGPINIGWISSLTGPLSSAAVAENKGVEYAVERINSEGGINGRKLALITRDTQGDPTKAVNAANELTLRDNVDFVIGPVNSGEAVPVVPVLAHAHTPNIIIATVDKLTNAAKYPLAFRVIPTNQEWVTAANRYVLGHLHLKKVAILADSTGYGTDTADQAKELFTAAGGQVTYSGLIDVDQTDVSSDIGKARASGAQAILVWSAASGLGARILNARSASGWQVPIVGHPALASGATGKLLTNKRNWDNVYAVGYRSMSRGAGNTLPPLTSQFIDSAGPSVLGKEIDYTLWWVAMGYDAVRAIQRAVQTAGSTDRDALQKAFEHIQKYPGVFGTYSYSATNRNGFPQDELVMNEANSFSGGTFQLAPGY